MSEFKDIVDTIVNIVGKIIPYFQKTDKDIQLFKELKEMADNNEDKKICDEKIRNLKVFQASKGSSFTYGSMMNFNKKYPAAQLHSHHFKFLSDLEYRLVTLNRDSERNIVEVTSLFSMADLNKKQFMYAKIMILGFFFMIIPTILKSSFVAALLAKYLPDLVQIIENQEMFFAIIFCCILAFIFTIVWSIRNVFDIYTLQELIRNGVVQEPLQTSTTQQLNAPNPTATIPVPVASTVQVENNDH
ncbi:hypothetical protein I5559_13020 [Acinetobacter oleivorans]|uniref:hypothetical protein n=1 Tax=Acinetobacter oleivorans TaxID=1148157 RepID=UPI001900EC89|nr:hypothetical protein [Acinetobacter oleivorans]MBJ9421310.1 hypothetical protein [Acinetobacter oleivorans]